MPSKVNKLADIKRVIANNIISMDISIKIIFFLFKTNPKIPIKNRIKNKFITIYTYKYIYIYIHTNQKKIFFKFNKIYFLVKYYLSKPVLLLNLFSLLILFLYFTINAKLLALLCSLLYINLYIFIQLKYTIYFLVFKE